MSRDLAKKIGIWFLAFFLFATHIFIRTVAHADEGTAWNLMVSRTGDCRINFPSRPQMVQQSLKMTEEGLRLNYDVYLAPFEDKGVCLLLIAQYPLPIAPGNELAGLEGLLNGIIGHNADNKLSFAKVIDLKGIPAVDFLVQNGTNYFRGLAFMSGNKLYLIAMEGKKGSLDEKVFGRFSNSFQLHKQEK
ncbi:MAG: hypothetical protein JSS32_09260 [Verrucomicrobia bacterium]|nr:hypothetical protein [Verrucomicrobiota bacterium]